MALAQITDHISGYVNYGWLDMQYDEYEIRDPGAGDAIVDVADDAKFGYRPQQTLAAGLGFTSDPIGDCEVVLSARIDALYVDDVWFHPLDFAPSGAPVNPFNDSIKESGYTLFHSSVTLSEIKVGPRSKMKFTLWGRNLLDEKYRRSGIDFSSLGFAGNMCGEPRTYGLTQLGVRLNAAQLAVLARFEQELVDWNSRVNLTAIRSSQEIRTKHFLDSLTCLLAFRDTPPERLIDVGTGAGFPGIPLKILYPKMQLTLVESVGKKADFCRHLVNLLHLESVQIIQERAETIGQIPAHRQQYDWALARAVAVMPVLVEYLLPLVRVGGAMLAMKGESAPAETQQADYAIRLLGGHLRKLIPITLPMESRGKISSVFCSDCIDAVLDGVRRPEWRIGKGSNGGDVIVCHDLPSTV